MEFLLNHPWLLGLLTAFLLSGAIEAGYQTGVRFRVPEDPNRKEQMEAIRDGLFILVGLLFGLTLALAAPRFAERRSLLVNEANAIGTAYLRTETLPQPNRDRAQQLLRQYVDTRLEVDGAGWDRARLSQATDRAKRIQEQLWEDVIEVTKSDRSAISVAYMNSLNQVIDLYEERLSSFENRIPRSVWLLIFLVSLIALFTRGLTVSGRFWLTLVLAPITVAIVVALIADLDSPGRGLIRLDQGAMLRLKADMSSRP